MTGSYTTFEVEAARRRELVESALREAAERRMLGEARHVPRASDEASPIRGLTRAATGVFKRASQRA